MKLKPARFTKAAVRKIAALAEAQAMSPEEFDKLFAKLYPTAATTPSRDLSPSSKA